MFRMNPHAQRALQPDDIIQRIGQIKKHHGGTETRTVLGGVPADTPSRKTPCLGVSVVITVSWAAR